MEEDIFWKESLERWSQRNYVVARQGVLFDFVDDSIFFHRCLAMVPELQTIELRIFIQLYEMKEAFIHISK
jgi:hypothetical protein